jgi:hypothetical protein
MVNLYKHIIISVLFLVIGFSSYDNFATAYNAHSDTSLIAKRDRQSRLRSDIDRTYTRREVRSVRFDERDNFGKRVYRDWEHVVDGRDYYNKPDYNEINAWNQGNIYY